MNSPKNSPAPRPRVAYLFARYPVVSQTFCDSEMLALESMGFDLEIIGLTPPLDSFRHERLDRLRAEMHYPVTKSSPPEFLEKLGPYIEEHDGKYGKDFNADIRARHAWHCAPLLRRLGVTHVHVHFANHATHVALFLKKLGFTFSFTPHAQDFMVDLGSDELMREMVKEAEFVVPVSDFTRDLIIKTCPGHDSKIIRIYNGIELNDFPVAQPDSAGPLKLISVGRLIEFKGFRYLIEAIGLLKKRGVPVDLRIVGEGPWRGDLEKQITAAGLDSEIHLLGVRSQEQIKSELGNAHAFVLGSVVDSKGACDILPTVITEAMATCLPVVSTTVTGIPEMVVPGETGLLVAPEDSVALADALQKIAEDPAARKRYGQAGRKRSEQLFALEITAGQLGENFRRVLANNDPLARLEPPIVYYCNQWDGKNPRVASLANDPRARLVVGSASVCDPSPDAPVTASMELVPDATVLESLWLRRTKWRHLLEDLRISMWGALEGEEFYRQARCAVWMADTFPRRGVKHLHAVQSDSIVCVWMWKKLTGLSISALVENKPTISRYILRRLLPDFDLATVEDQKLAKQGGSDAIDFPPSLTPDWFDRILPETPRTERIAVVIPCYNHAHYVGEALESVLEQTRKADRIIVIDDGSKDNSVEVLRGFADRGVEVYSQENQGAHYTINKLVELASQDCDYISILNSDDRYLPNRLEKCLNSLRQQPGKSVVATGLNVIDGKGEPEPGDTPRSRWFEGAWRMGKQCGVGLIEWLGQANFIVTTSNIFAQTSYLKANPFRPYRFNHDYFFLVTAALENELLVVETPLMEYRVHGSNTISTTSSALVREMIRMNLDLYRVHADALSARPQMRERFYSFVLSSWDSISSFHAGMMQVALAQLATKYTEEDIEKLAASLTGPEFDDFPNQGLVDKAFDGAMTSTVTGVYTKQVKTLKASYGKTRIDRDDFDKLSRYRQKMLTSYWIRLGLLLGGVRHMISNIGQNSAEKLAYMEKSCKTSGWLKLGEKLGSKTSRELRKGL